MKRLFLLSMMGIFFALSQGQAQNTSKFICKNFYGNGVNEYLVLGGTNNKYVYYYYTSTRPQRIKLITVSHKNVNTGYATEGMTITKVRFPNDTKVYELQFTVGEILCTHPNGRKQKYYYIPN